MSEPARGRRAGWVLCLLLAAIGWGRPCRALDPRKAITQYIYDQWTPKEGLPHVWTTCMLQTRDGYLWLGLSVGLVRFDGVRFTLFNKSDSEGLVGNNIIAMVEARDGSLWVSCLGAGVSRLKDGRFVGYTKADGLPHNEVWALAEDRDGRMWAGTMAGAAVISGGRIERLGAREGLTDGRVDHVRVGPDGSVWLVGEGMGLRRWKAGAVTAFDTDRDGLGPDDDSFFWDRSGNLWVARDEGLVKFRDGRSTRYPIPPDTYVFARDPARPDPHVRPESWAEDRDGNLWLAKGYVGIARFCPRDGSYTPFRAKDGLHDERVSCLLVDREDDLWFGTTGGGIARLKDGPFTSYAAEEGLTNLPMPNTIHAARDGAVWVHFMRFDGKAFTFVPDVSGPIAEADDGGLWFGTDGGPTRYKDGKAERFAYPGMEGVTALFADSRGTIWVGYSRGLARWRGGRWATFTTADGLTSNAIIAFAEGRDGSLWIGTRDAGLTRYRDGRFSPLTTAQGLTSDAIESLRVGDGGDLWIGTNGGGLNRYRDGRVSAYTSRDGLFDDVAFALLEDDDGDLWMGSEKGVYRVDIRDLDAFDRRAIATIPSRSYGHADGMKSISVAGHSQCAGGKGPDGRLWFCTIRGITVIDPRTARTNAVPPPVHLEGVVADKASYPVGRPVEAPPGGGSLAIRYTATSLRDPERVRFRYRLDGFDPEWVDAGARREAFYTNLPPGPYQFRVVASNGDGVWNPIGASVAVRLAPHFYQTTAFRLGCVAGMLLAVGGAYSARVAGLRARERELVRLVDLRTAELRREASEHREAREAIERQAEQIRRAQADLEEKNRLLADLAATDPLTGLKNRRHFVESLVRGCSFALRHRLPMSVILLDVDHFKQYNDAFGHPAGDEVLRTVADLLRRSLRESDLAARYGGEEFIILLPATDAPSGLVLAERLRATIASHPWPLRPVTASFGVSTLGPGGDLRPREAVVEEADRALYRSKRLGRDRVTHAEELEGDAGGEEDSPRRHGGHGEEMGRRVGRC